MGASRLYVAADDLLDLVVLALAETGGEPAPDRRYVSLGEPADDITTPEGTCGEQLTVHLDQLKTRALSTPCAVVPEATFIVRLVRCVPTQQDDGSGPTDDNLDASAETSLIDIWRTWVYLIAAYRELDACETITFGPATHVPPQGGVGGFRMPVTITISARAENS